MDEVLATIQRCMYDLRIAQKEDPDLKTDMEVFMRIFIVDEAVEKLVERVKKLKARP